MLSAPRKLALFFSSRLSSGVLREKMNCVAAKNLCRKFNINNHTSFMLVKFAETQKIFLQNDLPLLKPGGASYKKSNPDFIRSSLLIACL